MPIRLNKYRFFADVLGIDIDPTNMERALDHVRESLGGSRKGYVCVAGVHGVMEARRDHRLNPIYAGSEMTLPDGMPLVWIGRLQGHEAMRRVTGPDLMLEVFRREEFSHCRHFFYGGAPGIAEELKASLVSRFPWVSVVGTYTPPYCDLSADEESDLIARVSEVRPDIIWVGISTPRQELFMARYLARLDTKLMFGVGAAFDYHTGRIRDCDEWIKQVGMQWLHRLLQDPKRLWKRYLRNNPAFLWHITCQFAGLRKTAPSLRVSAPKRSAPSARVEARF